MTSFDLDHVALAFERSFDGLDRYAGDLGARFYAGGNDPGFYWGQVRFANGMLIELLEPETEPRDDFLRRFLDRNGPGPHHLTFKVPDIHDALDRVRAAGYEPARVQTESDHWREVFLHPKQSFGIVVQLAWVAPSGHEHGNANESLPPSRSAGPALLDRVVHLVADLDAALGLFRDVLDGVETESGTHPEGGRRALLAWAGPGRVELWQPDGGAPAGWLGSRPGRVHHIAIRVAEPEAVPHARRLSGERGDGGEVWEILPEHNHGTRLRLRRSPA